MESCQRKVTCLLCTHQRIQWTFEKRQMCNVRIDWHLPADKEAILVVQFGEDGLPRGTAR